MALTEKDIFCKVLKSIRAPDGYTSNILKCVQIEKRTIGGLKSHDNHVLMQNLLPIAVRRALPKHVVDVLIELSTFFRKLCSNVNDKFELEKIQDRIALTLCHLERIFSPSFFDIMEHLPIHLAKEALIAGVVQYRWMYPIERFLMTLKKYMRNKAHPEGSIAKGYVLEECMTFCSRYLSDVESNVYKLPRNNDGNHNNDRLIGNGKRFHLNHVTWVQAHRYMLGNSDAVKSYRDLHMSQLRSDFPRTKRKEIEQLHHERFHEWFKEYIGNLRISSSESLPEDIITLSKGPSDWGMRHKACIVHGFRFRVKSYDATKKTQNNGVFCSAYTSCYASSKDKRPQIGAVQYYGVLTDIIKIHYSSNLQYILFKCDWINNEKGLKVDDFKFMLVNFNHVMYTGESILMNLTFFQLKQSKSGMLMNHLNQNGKWFLMASKRKQNGKAMMDVIRETVDFCAVHDPSLRNRGCSKPIVRWNSGVKLQLELTPDKKIDGPDRIVFKTQLRVLARNSYRFPLIYTSFCEIPQHLLDDLWYEIK
ncbi:UNVERIFIED_CONTAM: hypothetical protein Slati_0205600, partial [Sesamum latifolium]